MWLCLQLSLPLKLGSHILLSMAPQSWRQSIINFHAAVEKRCQFYFDLLDIFCDHTSAQPWASLDQMKTSKAMCTSPRRAAHRMNYLDPDSSEEDNSNKNDEHDQNREEVVKALASARSVIGNQERATSMNEDEDDQDGTIELGSVFQLVGHGSPSHLLLFKFLHFHVVALSFSQAGITVQH